MVVNCEHVWKEISNYLDDEVSLEMRQAMEAHFRICKNCTSVLDGTRNVVQVYGDGRLYELPAGFSRRLRRRLAQQSSSWIFDSARTFWILTAAVLVLIVGGVALSNSSVFRQPDMRSLLAQSPHGVPSSLMVAVSSEGRLFHVPGCKYLHQRDGESPRMMTAEEAMKEGYVPCTRCLRQYLSLRVECPRPASSPQLSVSFPALRTGDSGF